jgi:hypothetical protein
LNLTALRAAGYATTLNGRRMTRGQHRGAFVIETPEGRRFDAALERFLAGNPFEFRDVAFRLAGDGAVCCAIDSSWQAPRDSISRVLSRQ